VAKQTLTPELALLHERRKIFFLDDLNSRRKQTRVDVYMGALKTFAGKQIYDLTDMDVLDFLIFKDVNAKLPKRKVCLNQARYLKH